MNAEGLLRDFCSRVYIIGKVSVSQLGRVISGTGAVGSNRVRA